MPLTTGGYEITNGLKVLMNTGYLIVKKKVILDKLRIYQKNMLKTIKTINAATIGVGFGVLHAKVFKRA